MRHRIPSPRESRAEHGGMATRCPQSRTRIRRGQEDPAQVRNDAKGSRDGQNILWPQGAYDSAASEHRRRLTGCLTCLLVFWWPSFLTLFGLVCSDPIQRVRIYTRWARQGRAEESEDWRGQSPRAYAYSSTCRLSAFAYDQHHHDGKLEREQTAFHSICNTFREKTPTIVLITPPAGRWRMRGEKRPNRQQEASRAGEELQLPGAANREGSPACPSVGRVSIQNVPELYRTRCLEDSCRVKGQAPSPLKGPKEARGIL